MARYTDDVRQRIHKVSDAHVVVHNKIGRGELVAQLSTVSWHYEAVHRLGTRDAHQNNAASIRQGSSDGRQISQSKIYQLSFICSLFFLDFVLLSKETFTFL